MCSGPIGLVHAERLLAFGACAGRGFPPGGGVVRTEFQPLLALGEPELAAAAAGRTRAGARKSASFPSVLPVVVEACERRFAGTRVSMRRISCTLR
jgi:hypothetical protein